MKLNIGFLHKSLIAGMALAMFFCFIGATQPAKAAGNTYYVALTGKDSNAGTLSAPFLTIQKGFNSASAGDTVVVEDGTYGPAGNYTCGTVCSTKGFAAPVQVNKSGTAGAPITIMAQNKWGAVIDCGLPTGYSGDGGDSSPAIQVCDAAFNFSDTASYITIKNFDITREYWDGAMVNGSANHDIKFIGNHFHNIGNRVYSVPAGTSSDGIVGVFAGTGTSNITWDSNVFNNIGRVPHSTLVSDDYTHDHGLYIYNGPYTITNNVFYNQPAGWDVQTSPGSHDIVIENNTMQGGANPQKDGAMILWGQNTNVTILNNIFYNGRNYAIDNYQLSPSNVTISNNIIYGSGSGLISVSGVTNTNNRLNTDPKFTNASGYDFHLTSGSPAIGTGAATPIISISTDLDGNPRPQGVPYDVGAYEYSSSITPSPTPAPVITSSLTTAAQATVSFSYQIVAANSPTSYSASGLPAGLSINSSTGLISGTPTTAGIYTSALAAVNSGGTGPATLTITVNAAPVITPQLISLSPTSLSFGNIIVGSTSTVQYITINNTTGSSYTINNVSLSGDYSFAGLGTCNVSVAVVAGQSCTISIQFNPTAVGVRNGSVIISDNASGSPRTINFTGTGSSSADTAAPSIPTGLAAIAASTNQINLSWNPSTDNVGVAGYKIFRSGIQIATTTLTSYSNTGLAASTAYTYTVSSYDTASNNSAQCPAITATTQTSVAVNQLPTGSLDGVNTTNQIFGWAQDPDNLSLPVTVHIYIDKNLGTAGASPIDVVASDLRSDVGNHAFNYTIPSSLYDGATHQVWVWASDLTATSSVSNIQLPGSPKSFMLAAPVIITQSPVTITPSSLNFDSTLVSSTSTEQYFTLTNTGSTDYIINNVSLSGDYSFAGLGTCNVSVAVVAGQSCTISIQFNPTISGNRTGVLTISDNLAGSPRNLGLAGVGTTSTPSPIPTPASLPYPSNTLVSDNGTVYEIEGASKIGFTSMKVFKGLGYNTSYIITGSTAAYSPTTYVLNSTTMEHPWGNWLSNGHATIYYSTQSGMVPVPSMSIFTADGGQSKFVIKMSSGDVTVLKANPNLPVLTIGDSRLLPNTQLALGKQGGEVAGASTIKLLTKKLYAGSKDPEVSILQQRLIDKGYLNQITGTFDAATVAAVKHFQADNNLPQTGIVAILTRTLLNSSY